MPTIGFARRPPRSTCGTEPANCASPSAKTPPSVPSHEDTTPGGCRHGIDDLAVEIDLCQITEIGSVAERGKTRPLLVKIQ